MDIYMCPGVHFYLVFGDLEYDHTVISPKIVWFRYMYRKIMLHMMSLARMLIYDWVTVTYSANTF